MSARQSNGELREIADLAVDRNRAAMLLGHDVVADRQAKAGPLADRLGGDEGLLDLGWNGSIITRIKGPNSLTPKCPDDLARSLDADRRRQDRQINSGSAERCKLFSTA
jgi:hypothetical protein